MKSKKWESRGRKEVRGEGKRGEERGRGREGNAVSEFRKEKEAGSSVTCVYRIEPAYLSDQSSLRDGKKG